jgi:hypothetical protein
MENEHYTESGKPTKIPTIFFMTWVLANLCSSTTTIAKNNKEIEEFKS